LKESQVKTKAMEIVRRGRDVIKNKGS